MQATAFLALHGLTLAQAVHYIFSHVHQPSVLFNTLLNYRVGSDMVAQIVQARDPAITVSDVRAFFAAHGHNSADLDGAYFGFLQSVLPPTLGTATPNFWVGDAGPNHADGLAGNDTLDGLDGDDILIGGAGDDVLRGGWGADALEGGPGADRLEAGRLEAWVLGRHTLDLSAHWLLGGLGDDTLHGGHGPDRLEGGDGADHLHAGADAAPDTLLGGSGSDRIWAEHNDHIDAGPGNDHIEITFAAAATALAQAGQVHAGEGADTLVFYGMRAAQGVHIHLTEAVQSRDHISALNLAPNHGLVAPVIHVHSLHPQHDQINIRSFNPAFPEQWFFAEAVAPVAGVNHSQILSNPSQPFMRAAPLPPFTADDHGKGFFVIHGAAAPSDHVLNVAAFLDPYGNNHRYGSRLEHYFLLNVGSADSALYLFRDDGAADNHLSPAELTPIVRLVGLRTEQFSSTDLASVFI